MGSLISDAQKAKLSAVMQNVHDTFARTIKCFKEGKKIVIATSPQYSSIYKQPGLNNTKLEVVERDIQARIFYFPRKQEKETVAQSPQDSLKLLQDVATVRLKIIKADWEFLSDADRIIVDGRAYEIVSSEIPTGLFGDGFYTLLLRRTD